MLKSASAPHRLHRPSIRFSRSSAQWTTSGGVPPAARFRRRIKALGIAGSDRACRRAGRIVRHPAPLAQGRFRCGAVHAERSRSHGEKVMPARAGLNRVISRSKIALAMARLSPLLSCQQAVSHNCGHCARRGCAHHTAARPAPGHKIVQDRGGAPSHSFLAP